jgi:hypothetical protein
MSLSPQLERQRIVVVQCTTDHEPGSVSSELEQKSIRLGLDPAAAPGGQLEISGQRLDLVGWVKLSKKGNKYLSILATPQSANIAKEEQR